MLKRLSMSTIAVAAAVAWSGSARAADTKRQTWDLARDFRLYPAQANPNPDVKGKATWYFLRSADKTHDPATYDLLPNFLYDMYHIAGMQGWQGDCWDPVYTAGPSVDFNAGQDFSTWPIGKVQLQTTGCPQRMTIVGWRSPVGGTVNVKATFGTMNPTCGDGVTWYVDKGASTLASGLLPPGAAPGAYAADVSVSLGDFLYFVVDGYQDYYCDQIDLDLVITK